MLLLNEIISCYTTPNSPWEGALEAVISSSNNRGYFMHYDMLPTLHYICERSHFHYWRQFLALKFRLYLHLVYKTDFPLSFDTGVGDERNMGKNVKHGQRTMVTSIWLQEWKEGCDGKACLRMNITPLLEFLLPQE